MDEFGPLNLLPRKGKAWRPQFTLPCLIPPKFPVR